MRILVEQIADQVLRLYGARALMTPDAPETVACFAQSVTDARELGAVLVEVEDAVRVHLGRPAGMKDEHLAIFFARVARRLTRLVSRAA